MKKIFIVLQFVVSKEIKPKISLIFQQQMRLFVRKT